jgi:hypothetical protein
MSICTCDPVDDGSGCRHHWYCGLDPKEIQVSNADAQREFIERLDRWLDENVSAAYQAQPLAQDWARVGKVIEELGEAIQALIGCTGQNPRKGHTNNLEDMLDEVADTIITGYLAIQHFTKDIDRTEQVVDGRWAYRMQKMHLPSEPHSDPRDEGVAAVAGDHSGMRGR